MHHKIQVNVSGDPRRKPFLAYEEVQQAQQSLRFYGKAQVTQRQSPPLKYTYSSVLACAKLTFSEILFISKAVLPDSHFPMENHQDSFEECNRQWQVVRTWTWPGPIDPPHWDHGKNPKNPFKLLINILNIYKYHLRRIILYHSKLGFFESKFT